MNAERADRENQADDVREAALRYMLEAARKSGGKRNHYYLGIGPGRSKADPSDAFLERFAGHEPLVKKQSECLTDGPEGVRDKSSGERGLLFALADIRWITDTEVHVPAGWFGGFLYGYSCNLELKTEDGQWKVLRRFAVSAS